MCEFKKFFVLLLPIFAFPNIGIAGMSVSVYLPTYNLSSRYLSRYDTSNLFKYYHSYVYRPILHVYILILGNKIF